MFDWCSDEGDGPAGEDAGEAVAKKGEVAFYGLLDGGGEGFRGAEAGGFVGSKRGVVEKVVFEDAAVEG